ncbi:MAG: ribonuclease HII [Acidobacteria bacterium]|nr:ribonuclease HII [Acidobacteriota bacterium]
MVFSRDAEFKDWRTGIDEAGRGCLAGPVVVASVTWRQSWAEQQTWFSEVKDSKMMTATQRARICTALLRSVRVRVSVVHPLLVDLMNVTQASLHGFELVAPPSREDHAVIVDGHLKPVTLAYAHAVVKGDRHVSCVAAASIVAKNYRDQLMVQAPFQDYGFAVHKGYGTARHLETLQQLGPCPFHRKSFEPVRKVTRPSAELESSLWWALSASLTQGELQDIWMKFLSEYHLVDLSFAHRITARFQSMGLKILPTPDAFKPEWGRH